MPLVATGLNTLNVTKSEYTCIFSDICYTVHNLLLWYELKRVYYEYSILYRLISHVANHWHGIIKWCLCSCYWYLWLQRKGNIPSVSCYYYCWCRTWYMVQIIAGSDVIHPKWFTSRKVQWFSRRGGFIGLNPHACYLYRFILWFTLFCTWRQVLNLKS